MRSRFLSHLHDTNSAVYKHLQSHNINTSCPTVPLPLSWKIVASNLKHPNIRKTVEAIHIRKNERHCMNGCIGRELDV